MREIKFRGRRIDNGELVYGSLIKRKVNNHAEFFGENVCFIVEDINPIAMRRASMPEYDFRSVRVDPATVGQFTGLHDKNGKEIYEGDIVTGLDSIPSMIKAWGWDIKVGEVCYVVTWHEGKYHLNKLDGTIGWIINWHISSKVKDLSVIGNIYENPELLSIPTPRQQIPDGGIEE